MIAGSLNEEPIDWIDIQNLLNRAHKKAGKRRVPKKQISTLSMVTDEQLQDLSSEVDLSGRVFRVNRKSLSALRRPGKADRLRAHAMGIKLTGGEFFQGQNR
jgi:hypothetical protein